MWFSGFNVSPGIYGRPSMKNSPRARFDTRATAADTDEGYITPWAVRYCDSWEKSTLPGRAEARTPAYRDPGAIRAWSEEIRVSTGEVRADHNTRGTRASGSRQASDTWSQG